jgi:hypothetical protein
MVAHDRVERRRLRTVPLPLDLAAVTEETIFAGASKEGSRRKLRQAERAGRDAPTT